MIQGFTWTQWLWTNLGCVFKSHEMAPQHSIFILFKKKYFKKTEGDAHEVGDRPVKVYRLHISYKASKADKYTIRVV